MGSSSSRGEIKLYYLPASAPCRSVMLTAAALDIKMDLHLLNIMNGEHLKPEFLKINPQHCIPTMVDGDFILWESRAICKYLVNMYAKNDSLYPKDAKKRAIIDSRLDFDQGTLYHSLSGLYVLYLNGKTPSEEHFKKIKDAFDMFEILLNNNKWTAGDEMTIADFALVATVSTAEASGQIKMHEYKNIKIWLERCKNEMKGYIEANENGLDVVKETMKTLLEKFPKNN